MHLLQNAVVLHSIWLGDLFNVTGLQNSNVLKSGPWAYDN